MPYLPPAPQLTNMLQYKKSSLSLEFSQQFLVFLLLKKGIRNEKESYFRQIINTKTVSYLELVV